MLACPFHIVTYQFVLFLMAELHLIMITKPCLANSINSLAPRGSDYNLKLVNFKLIWTIIIWSIFCEIAIRWIRQYLADHKSTLVQVMAWCHQATSHYLSQCSPRSMSPYEVTRQQWVNRHTEAMLPLSKHSQLYFIKHFLLKLLCFSLHIFTRNGSILLKINE